MKFTGERYVPSVLQAQISYYHWHRYLYASHFCENKIVLDIACGEGYGSYLLSEHAQKVVGVDIDFETIQHAEKTYQRNNLEFICGAANQIPIHGEHVFDLIVNFETIEHLTEEHQNEFLQEAKRLLKPDGVLLISTPNKVSYSDQRSYKNPFHLKEFLDAEFSDFLSRRFMYVNMLRQHIYPASFIWEEEIRQNQNLEYQITSSDDGFFPCTDKKSTFFFIAHCSDTMPDALPASHLIDLSGSMFIQNEKPIQELKAQVTRLQGRTSELDQQLQTILKSKRWRLLTRFRKFCYWLFPVGSIQERFIRFIFKPGK